MRAERARAENAPRDQEIWRLHDSDLSVRQIKDRLNKKRSKNRTSVSKSTVHRVIQQKPVGQGELDARLRSLALQHTKRGKHGPVPHLTRIATEVGLPSTVVREWVRLPPGPDYRNEYAARLAAKAARKPRDKSVTAMRRLLQRRPYLTAEQIALEFPEIERSVVEQEISRQSEREAARRFWSRKRKGEINPAGELPRARSPRRRPTAAAAQRGLELGGEGSDGNDSDPDSRSPP